MIPLHDFNNTRPVMATLQYYARHVVSLLLLALCIGCEGREYVLPKWAEGSTVQCDVIVAGGSTAALATALVAAEQFALSPSPVRKHHVCLTEPTFVSLAVCDPRLFVVPP